LEEASKKMSEEHETEVAGLETRVRERGQQAQLLEAEVERRDGLVRELLAMNLPAPTDGPPNGPDGGAIADLSARLDRIAGEAALREADLVAARWKIAQLERELTQHR
jgi:hypothetical protein